MARVLVNIKNNIAEVVLNRAEKMNALDAEMFEAIIEAGNKVAANENVRAVVLRGEGKAFCSGLDTSMFSLENPELNNDLRERTYGTTNKWQEVVWTWRKCPVPVIAAGQGFIYGGGLQIFSGADIKFIHPETQLSIMEMRWGIVPDMAGTQIWRYNVREDILKELTFTNRKFTAKEAVDFGFATYLKENPVDAAFDLAQEIASKSPSAIVKAKQLLNEMHNLSPEDGLMAESIAQQEIIRQHNQIEAVFSTMQKRAGNFKPYRNAEKEI